LTTKLVLVRDAGFAGSLNMKFFAVPEEVPALFFAGNMDRREIDFAVS
jgi:hypothetical protein